jgi:predicted flap endonuclease-1-like 5' DNA nuclease
MRSSRNSKPWCGDAPLAEVGVQAVIEHDRTSIIATLEKASVQLEASMGNQRENEKSWKLVREAIDHLRSIEGGSVSIDDRSATDVFDKADDLTSIRGISTAFAEHLASLGVTRYAEIASWRADDVRRVAQALELPSEINSQNWIEQAALLERRKNGLESETPNFLQKAGGAPAPGAMTSIDFPEILAAIRNDEPSLSQRRLEHEKQRLTRKSGRGDELPGEAEETAVTFVIREEAQVQAPTTAPTTPSLSSALLRHTSLAELPDAAKTEAYVASWGATEEAEVVVVKTVVQNRHGPAAPSEAGPVRRLLKALTGG